MFRVAYSLRDRESKAPELHVPALAIDHCVPFFRSWLTCKSKLGNVLNKRWKRETEEEQCKSAVPLNLMEEKQEDSMYNRKL